MELSEFAKKILAGFQSNATKMYLVLANVILTIFAIWFSNIGLLPFRNVGDFAFFVVLVAIFAFYRPGWAFVLFVGSVILENINLAPVQLGIAVRPYQLLGALILLAVSLRFLAGRKVVEFPRIKWHDALPILFLLGGFLSAFGAADKTSSFKQAVVATSFVALYFLVKLYVQSLDDLKRIAPFFLTGGVVVVGYAIWQNVRFLSGGASFEVMSGRPNATFAEPDWFGIYLVFLLSVVLTIIFYQNKKKRISDFQFPTPKRFELSKFLSFRNAAMVTNYGLLVTSFIALLLTVSRSAWIGAVLIVAGFLKITLLYGDKTDKSEVKNVKFWEGIVSTIRKPWCWKEFSAALGGVALVILFSLGIVYVYGLTSFQLGSRAQSTGGLQKITIACQAGLTSPSQISDISELAQYGCRHINLEEIAVEKAKGNVIQEIYRPDPNVGIRAKIYRISIEQIKKHPLFGIGWGSISNILGTDERGAGLNASNIFLEIWLGSGLLGLLSFLILLGYVSVASCVRFVRSQGADSAATFIIFGLFAIIIPNLFNSGIFLGFVWVYLAAAVGLLSKKN